MNRLHRHLSSRAAILSAWLLGFLIVAATLGAYWPALHGDFVFDDRTWTTDVEKLLRDFSGLWRIWTEPTALQQYYPLTGTSFWLDYQLWHWWTLPYHVENVLLHASCALLLWRLLCKLEVPGAWLTGALFALHPVMVESTAWITERKNVLSMLLFLASLLTYGRFSSFWKEEENQQNRGWFYALALLLFVGALLSKISTFALPPVLLLLCWWKRGHIRWKQDVLPTLPFFALSIGLGLLVTWLEKHHVGAQGAEWDLSWPERILVAGRVPWFYLGKLLWPTDQCLIYPRWQLDVYSLWQWLFPLGLLVLLGLVWLLRGRLGRGPLVAFLYFVGTLFPVLGLINFYWMRFSYVGDHLVYLSSPAVLSLGVVLVGRAAAKLRQPLLLRAFALLVLPLFAVLAWREAGQYKDAERLWRMTISRNPACWLAHSNLGFVYVQNGQVDEAMIHYQEALQLKPDYADAHSNLGNAFRQKGQVDEALLQYKHALDIEPDFAEARNNLGNTLLQVGQVDEAIAHFQSALKSKPDYADAHSNLGNAFRQKGQVDEAITHYLTALEIKPDFAAAHNNLAVALLQKGQVDEAILHCRKALKIKPNLADTHYNLGNALRQKGQVHEAIVYYQKTLELKPDFTRVHLNFAIALHQAWRVDEALVQYEMAIEINPMEQGALNNLAWILATSPEASLRNGARALELAQRAHQLSGGNHPQVLHTLAAAYAECGRFAEANESAERALSLAISQGNSGLVEIIRNERRLYQAGKPFREALINRK